MLWVHPGRAQDRKCSLPHCAGGGEGVCDFQKPYNSKWGLLWAQSLRPLMPKPWKANAHLSKAASFTG